ncbi:MAG: hypothetical protein SFU84_11255 [Gemmatimonadales bacterium]|nr:hypothetical protein [Gemmatimonadales bacterium]
MQGLDTILILELKRSGVSVGAAESQQALSYGNKLLEVGGLSNQGKIVTKVLGSSIEGHHLSGLRTTDDRLSVDTVSYVELLAKARARMLNLERLIRERTPAGEFNPIDPELEAALNPAQLDLGK